MKHAHDHSHLQQNHHHHDPKIDAPEEGSCCHHDPLGDSHQHGGGKLTLGPVISAFVLAGLAFFFSMPTTFGLSEASSWMPFAAAGCSILSVLLFGRKFLTSIAKIFRSSDMNTLIGVSLIASWALSFFHLYQGRMHETYFDAAAFITAFVLLGQQMEIFIQRRIEKRLKAFESLVPESAHRLEGGEVLLKDLKEKDRIKVLVGERVPVDVQLISDSSFDESVVTGESKPTDRRAGEEVAQGALNVGVPFEAFVLRGSAESMYEVLVKQVRQTLKKKPPFQKKVDRIATFFVPFVIFLALAAGFYWWKQNPESSLYMTFALAILVVACPCAIGIATPTAFLVGVLRAARSGILVRSLEALDRVGEVTVIAFDKTGTLTEGKPVVSRMKTVENLSHSELLQWAASVERDSEHPYATAIRERALIDRVKPLETLDFQFESGKGIKAKLKMAGGKTEEVFLGNLVWLFENGFDSTKVPGDFQWEVDGTSETALWLGVGKEYKGLIFLKDPIRASAREMVQELSNAGFEVGMITGDSENVARAVSKELGFKFYHAGVVPSEKATIVKRLSQKKKKGLDYIYPKVCFVGDGINDAPALAEAHLGIAMSSGSSLAQATAQVVLPSSALRKVTRVFEELSSTKTLIQQNLWLSFGYNIIALPIAAGVLYPKWGILLSPVIAAVAMAISSLLVLLNSVRVLAKAD